MADDILDLIDHAIADHGWDMSDDAMRWAPTVTKDTLDEADRLMVREELAAFGEAFVRRGRHGCGGRDDPATTLATPA